MLESQAKKHIMDGKFSCGCTQCLQHSTRSPNLNPSSLPNPQARNPKPRNTHGTSGRKEPRAATVVASSDPEASKCQGFGLKGVLRDPTLGLGRLGPRTEGFDEDSEDEDDGCSSWW